MTESGVTIASSDGATTATFLPSANLVCTRLQHGGEDWLDPEREREALETGKDYGIAFVHPWAGRLAGWNYEAAGREVKLCQTHPALKVDKWGRPIHGVWDRLLRWEMAAVSDDRFEATLTWDSEDLLEVFPYPHEVSVVAKIEHGSLHLETLLRPTSAAPVPVTFGYHAFLRLPGSDRSNWTLSVQAAEVLALGADLIPNGDALPLVEREYLLADRDLDYDIGALPAFAVLSISDGSSAAEVILEEGFAVAHLFGPPQRNLVSFEPMTAPSNALRSGHSLRAVEQGEIFRTSLRVGVRTQHERRGEPASELDREHIDPRRDPR